MAGYPTPLYIEPLRSHTRTFILLHGLGNNGPLFGNELLAAKSSEGLTLQETFPGMKFIFPTARKSRSTVFKRIKINQWFNMASLDDKTEREELEIDGLRETSCFIRGLIEAEMKSGIPEGNILLGGLSQGFAASIYTLLTLEARIGAYVGLSGYFPFVKDVEDIIGAENAEEEDDDVDIIFGGDEEDADGETPPLSKADQAVNFLRENIDLPTLREPAACLKVPVFLGHGEKDEKVPISTGERARDALCGMGMDVTWRQYRGLGHWYEIPDEIDDVISFVKKNVQF